MTERALKVSMDAFRLMYIINDLLSVLPEYLGAQVMDQIPVALGTGQTQNKKDSPALSCLQSK